MKTKDPTYVNLKQMKIGESEIIAASFPDKIGVLNLFINKPYSKYYLSPGPMKVAGNLEFSIYVDNNIMRLYTEDQVKEAKGRAPRDLKNLFWYVPGGYQFGIKFEGNLISLVARPNSAQGYSLLFESFKGDEKKFLAEVKKYSTEKSIRQYLKKFDGKRAQFAR